MPDQNPLEVRAGWGPWAALTLALLLALGGLYQFYISGGFAAWGGPAAVTAEPAPEPVPAPEPEPVPEPVATPDPVPESVPEPEPEPVPEPPAPAFTLASLQEQVAGHTPLYFVKDTARLLPGEEEKLQILTNYLANYEGVVLRFRGHTADVWIKRAQRILSLQRARTVEGLLKGSLGSVLLRTEAVGLGSEELVRRGNDEASRRVNRRVEIQVLDARPRVSP